MKISMGTVALSVLLLGVTGPGRLMGQTVSEESVVTGFTVVIGFPTGPQSATGGALLVPGTVIPLVSESGTASETVRRDAAMKGLSFSKAVEKLWATFRLDPGRQLQETTTISGAAGKTLPVAVPQEANIGIAVTLVSFDDKTAAYRVIFRQGEKVLADSPVNVSRGGRAVVGGMDGEAAPYIFLFIEPEGAGGSQSTPGVTKPVMVRNTNPSYPESARKDKVMGTVVLDLLIDARGGVQEINVIESPDARLSEAAVAAVRQWQFEPARLPDGRAVAVFSTISVRFWLK